MTAHTYYFVKLHNCLVDLSRAGGNRMTHKSDAFISFVIKRRVAVLAICAVLTAFLGFFITRIEVNNDPTQNIPENLPAYVTYKELQAAFPSPRKLLVIARFDTGQALSEKIANLTSWGERFDAINGLSDVIHLGTLRVPVKGGFLGVSSEFVVPQNEVVADSILRRRIAASADFTGPFISADETVLGMIMSLDDAKNQVSLVSQAVALQKQINSEGRGELVMTGAPLYTYFIDKAMRRDFRLLLPACLLVVFGLLFWVFRRMSYVFASLAVTTVALVWTFGLLGLTGNPFSVVTSVIPVILFPIGVASAIHVFKTYARNRELHAGADKVELIHQTFGELAKPILLSAITTFVGFISFAGSRVTWTRIFGIFTAIGVALALLFSLVLLPIVLYYVKDWTGGSESKKNEQRGGSQQPFWWPVYARFTASRFQWIGVVIAIVIVGAVGYMRVTVEGNPIDFFPPRSDVRRSDKLIETYLGGTRFINIVIQADSVLAHKNQWEEIDAIEAHVDSLDMVGASTSLLLLIKSVSRMISRDTIAEPALTMILNGKSLLGKKFGRFVDAWVSPDRHSTKISLICKNVTGTRYSALTREIADYITTNYPHYRTIVTGPPVLNDAMTFLLVQTQRQSLLFAFISVFLVLCLIFRSLKIGLFAIFPIILSTTFVYALMGILGVAINAVTIITVNTCIGIGIDYAIHFVAGYLYVRPHHGSRIDAITETVHTRGAVIMGNTFVVGIGFLVLAFSTFPPIRHFGLFVCISMVTSSVFALLFLPTLLQNYGATLDKPVKP